jgi:hypothetical protein
MAIKHLSPHSDQEIIKMYRKIGIDEKLLNACATDSHIFNLVNKYLENSTDLKYIQESERVIHLNMFFKAFFSYAKNESPKA